MDRGKRGIDFEENFISGLIEILKEYSIEDLEGFKATKFAEIYQIMTIIGQFVQK